MPIVGVYEQYRYGFGAYSGGSGSWTVDFEIASSTVLAFSNLSNYYSMDASYGYAFSGVQSYVTLDPNTQIPLPHDVGSGVFLTGVVPSIFDNNVITVTFGYGSAASNGDSGVYADAIFHVFVWG